jgi:glycosyltransferase involved in cell wall biosynthesis
MSVNQHIAVSVIIATHNRADRLRETLEALLDQKTPDSLGWEVVVVDNGSTDDTLETFRTMAMRAPGRLRYVSEPRVGKSRALNAGLKVARGKVVALTDDDVSPADDWVATSATVLDKWDAHGAGGRILPRWEAEPPKWLLENRRLLDALGIMAFDGSARLPITPMPPGGHPQVWGGNMVYRRSALLALGGFDVALGPMGGRRYCEEDVDVVRRMLEAGRSVVYDPELVVFHRIPGARVTRAYFRRLMWDMGEGQALAAADSRSSPTVAGVPRWRYLYLARLVGGSVAAVLRRRPDAFDEVLDCAMAAGMTWGEMKRARRERREREAHEDPRPDSAPAVRAR